MGVAAHRQGSMEAADGFTVSNGLEDDYRVGAAVLEKPDPAELRRADFRTDELASAAPARVDGSG